MKKVSVFVGLALLTTGLLLTACGPAPAAPTVAPAPPPTQPAAAEPVSAAPTAAPAQAAGPTTAPAAAGKAPLPTPTRSSTGLATSAEELQRVSPEEVKALIESGAPIVVVDNQPDSAYQLGHVKTAVNLPWDADLKDAGNLPKDKLLILYCGCAHEEDSSDMALQLMSKFGYRNVMLLDGGWLKWSELGFPIDKAK